jgi:aminomethyltransferase
MREDEEIPIETATLPLDAWHRAKGGRMVEFAGYWMPIQYEGIMAEHLWTRENAGLFDVSHMGQLSLSGDNVAEALETLVPGDISALKPGRMRYSLLLDEDGGILDDLMITNEGDQYGIVVNGAVKWEDIGHLRENLPDDITLNHNEDYGLLALQGPKAVDALSRLIPEAATLVFMQATRATWQGHAIGLSRSGYTGEDGFEISLPNEALTAFADALCAMDEVKPIGLGARDSLRLEAGLPLYGHDLSPEIDPAEADLGFAVSKRRREEENFPGAARILGHLEDGPPRKRVGLTIDGKLPVREGAKLFDGEDEIGVVTSGGFAPSVGAPIAMGFVPTGLSEPGTAIAAEVRGKLVHCTVTAMPFIPHRYVRKQGA